MEQLKLRDTLRQAIHQSKQTLTELATQSEISLSSLSRFKDGERDVRLEAAERLTATLGYQLVGPPVYLPSPKSIYKALEEVVTEAQEFVKSIGSKSTSEAYLKTIQSAVLVRGIRYDRLLTGTYITHELHSHLGPVRRNAQSRVRVRRLEPDNVTNLTVTDGACVLALQGNQEGELYGLRLDGAVYSRQFSEYFWRVFDDDEVNRHVPDDELARLCLECESDQRDLPFDT